MDPESVNENYGIWSGVQKLLPTGALAELAPSEQPVVFLFPRYGVTEALSMNAEPAMMAS